MPSRVVALLAALTVLTLAPPVAASEPAPGTVSVDRLAGDSRVGTAVAMSSHGWQTAESVIVATARDFPDALAAGPLAAHQDAPLLLVEPDHLPDVVTDELLRLGAATVTIVGGTAAVSADVERTIADVDGVVEVDRISGHDRFETAALVALEVGARHGEVVVASGEAFPDALAGAGLPGRASPAADSTEQRYASTDHAPPPVLLTRAASLPAATAAALDHLAVDRVTIIGGAAVVGEDVEGEIGERADDALRIAGADRYATALAVFEEAHRRGAGGTVVAATGQAFADGLAAGALTARLDGLLALTPGGALPDPLDHAVRELPVDTAMMVGGRAALRPHVRSELAAALAGMPRPFVTVASEQGFRGVASPLPPDVAAEMQGSSWEDDCPVGLDDLALATIIHHDFTGGVRTGELVVAARVGADVLGAFAHIYDAGFVIERMERIDVYGGDDHASMDANNTSAFNCRPVEGGSRWSEHAYGTAIDINPVQNPYRRGDTVLPEAGRAFLDRGDVRPGMIVRPGPVLEAFEALGWGWGGDWSSLDDWMHVSESGR